MIKATIPADSLNEFGNRVTTMQVTFPRIILAELNTHRMFSRNSASSRAIPFRKMLKSVMENPFVPIAWQKDHKGMQGKEYLDPTVRYAMSDDVMQVLADKFDYNEGDVVDPELINLIKTILSKFTGERTLPEWWLYMKDRVVECAVFLSCVGITKQLANRLLEPFMWHTVIVTATEWENFFALRCPQYNFELTDVEDITVRSRKDMYKKFPQQKDVLDGLSDMDWLRRNMGQAEIHMMALAEAMWDALQESKPVQLKAGEWHIPYRDEIEKLYENTWFVVEKEEIPAIVKISTVMCARVSYTVVGTELSEWTIDKYVKKCDELAAATPIHASPFEHCARTMSREEFESHINGNVKIQNAARHLKLHEIGDNPEAYGWCGNFRGFIQYRKMIPNENITK